MGSFALLEYGYAHQSTGDDVLVTVVAKPK